MKSIEIGLWIRYRAIHEESVESRHEEVMRKMVEIDGPLSFKGMILPPTPYCEDGLCTSYILKYPIRGLRCEGSYEYRDPTYDYEDHASYDDSLCINFKTSNKALDYSDILHHQLPKVVRAFRGYKAHVRYGLHGMYYCGGIEYSNPVYNGLLAEKSINVDGRNNIYTLKPAHYWDEELCRRALGYGPEEVIRRLEGKVPRVERLMDGVYVVFNDDPALSYAGFVEINDRFKRILGLI